MHVEHLDARVDAQRIEHEQDADHGDERKGQYLHFGIAVDELGNRVDEHHHDDHSGDDRDDHDDEVVGQAHGRDDRVDGKHDVHDHDGADCLRQAYALAISALASARLVDIGKRNRSVQLGKPLVNKIRPADEQHEIANREPVRPKAEIDRKQGRDQMNEIRRHAQEQDAHDHGAGKAELAADMALLGREALRRDGDEHNVVHPEHDFQKHQGHERDPGFSRCKYGQIEHRSSLTSHPITEAQKADDIMPEAHNRSGA